MPRTLHLDAHIPEDVQEAGRLLRSGGLVAFATETVYGLGANALDVTAVARIFAAKERPAWDPLIVHVADSSELERVAEVSEPNLARVRALAKAFWPGPLTLLLPRKAIVPDAVTAGRALVGVRVPAHSVARTLLRAAGVPVAAPSANRFGHTSPTTAAHVLADLDGRIDAVLDAGSTTVGVESTVLDPTQTPMMLYRPGIVTADRLVAVAGVKVVTFTPTDGQRGEPESLPSPGVGIRHYAPRSKVQLVDCLEGMLTAVAAVRHSGERVGVLLPEGWACAREVEVFAWGRWDDANTLAARLFAGLRDLDDRGVTRIIAPLPPAGGVGDAIRDRLLKAAREK